MRFSAILLSLVFLGAGCLSTAPVEVTTEITSPAVTESPIETTAYAMSGSQLMLSIPSVWTIYQQDGGTASAIVAKSATENEWINIGVERTRQFGGEIILYADWMEKKQASWLERQFTFSPSDEIETVDGLVFDSLDIVTEAGEARTILTGEMEGGDGRYFVTITTPTGESDTYDAILDSIIFNPSEEELSVAQIIH